MIRNLVTIGSLTLVWVALWGSFTPGNILAGLLVATSASLLVPIRGTTERPGFRPISAMRLAGFFLWKLVEASVIVAWEIATPKDRTSPAVVSVPLNTNAPGLITAVANMVSLTPGTLTLEVDRESSSLYIHVLHFESAEVTSAAVFQLERLTMAAFPPKPSQVLDRGVER